LIASRLERTPVNGAFVHVTVGMLLGPQGLALVDLNVDGEGIKRVAELTLAVGSVEASGSAGLIVTLTLEVIGIGAATGLGLAVVGGLVLGLGGGRCGGGESS